MENERKRLKFEVLLERYFSNFHRILLTNLLFAVPSAVIFAAIYFLNISLFHGAVSTPLMMTAIIPLYPFFAGVVMVCRNIARGDSSVSVFSSFIDAVKVNFFPFLLNGLLVYVVAMLSYLSIRFYISMISVGWFIYVLLFFAVIISLFMLYALFYVPLMCVTYDLPLRFVYKNSLLMSFGEFKNNLFATIALAVIFGICFTVTAFLGSETALLIVLAALWVLWFPATCTFMVVFFIYDGMVAIIRNKEDISRELSDSIDKSLEQRSNRQTVQPTEEDFSDIDIASLKDTDDYIFHNGRMVKQSVLLRKIREHEKQKEQMDDN